MTVDQNKLTECIGRFVADLGATGAAGNVVVGGLSADVHRHRKWRSHSGSGPLQVSDAHTCASTPATQEWRRNARTGHQELRDAG